MKKNETLKTIIQFSSLVALLSCLILFVSPTTGCKKKNSEEDTQSKKIETTSLTQIAKNYFADLVNKEGVAIPQSSTAKQTTKGNSKSTSRLLEINSKIQFDKATLYQRDGISYAIVPLKEEIKPFKNKSYEFFRDVIFYQDKDKKTNMMIVEVLGNKNESLGNSTLKIASAAFENKFFSQSQDLDALNASVIFYNEKYSRDASFKIEKGKWVSARISFRSDLEIKQ